MLYKKNNSTTAIIVFHSLEKQTKNKVLEQSMWEFGMKKKTRKEK